MSYVFKIDSDSTVSHVNHKGWTGSSVGFPTSRIETILDPYSGKITDAMAEAAKSGTSIPSPFARLYHFDTAFRMVQRDPNPKEVTLYHILVSHCLDLLELLFQAGNSSDITYKPWKLSRLKAMQSLPDIGGRRHPHRVFADALDLDMRGDLANIDGFILIYFKGALVGGTSPLTLVFLSPNWEQERSNRHIDPPKSANGRELFGNEYVPIEARDGYFVNFLNSYFKANRELLRGGLREYLFRVFEDFVPFGMPTLTVQGMDKYEVIRVAAENDAPLAVTPGLPLYKVLSADISKDIEEFSSFLMSPTQLNFEREVVSQGVKIHKPLVLTQEMEGLYLRDVRWSPDFRIVRSAYEGVPLSERYLPGVDNIKYPFVTTEDFLEDRLVQMPFKLNKERFLTGSKDDVEFLLPIKKEYFNFFTAEDLKSQLQITRKTGTQNGAHVDELVASLNIPIRNRRTVQLRKTYSLKTSENGQVESSVSFMAGLGFFPFYKFTHQDGYLKGINEYTVMLADLSSESAGFAASTGIRFFRAQDAVINRSLPVNPPKARSPKRENEKAPGSYYYKVGEEFDFLEISLYSGGIPYKGLVIPAFDLVDGVGHKQFTFAIDFGTSSTHVAYNTDTNPEPQSLTVSDADFNGEKDKLQMVLLNKSDDEGFSSTSYERHTIKRNYGRLTQIEAIVRQEFMPAVIGSQFGSLFSFPLRTTVFEKIGVVDEGNNLFNNINIGFNIDLEQTVSAVNHYVTNLKWSFENTPANSLNRPRVRAFFEGLFSLIRNKVLLNHGDLKNTKIVWLMPSSMKRRIADNLTEELAEAFKNIFGNGGQFVSEPISESLAPYFYLKTLGVRPFADTVNIDIGGGTTDIMLFMQERDRFLNTSFRFAGYDIWGGGVGHDGKPGNSKDNGFIQNYDLFANGVARQSDVFKDSILRSFKEKKEFNGEDVVSLLFKYDDYYNFSRSIKDTRPRLKLVLFLHYAAIVYHLIQLLQKNDLPIPRYLTFTGRGSQYLRLLGSNRALIEFTRLLINSYSSMVIPPSFEIVLTDNPKETTANGAVLYSTSSEIKTKYEQKLTDCYWGESEGEQFDFAYRNTHIKDVLSKPEFENSVVNNAQRFIELTLNNKEINNFLGEYGISSARQYIPYLVAELSDSYKLCISGMQDDGDELLSETFFFLPLKNTLYEFSKYLLHV
ncbi:hypothetical protein [Dyadobacter bucti]|uniref:hypothetical protein n=1 Tax=Dyadobacter bucti TaxID=2572203 RepID=UPI001108209C|nr:hypothetical protein [Dyadobacter bucti]